MKKHENMIYGQHPHMYAPILVCPDIDSFVTQIYSCLHARRIVPTDTYLVYDDPEVCTRVLDALRAREIDGQKRKTMTSEDILYAVDTSLQFLRVNKLCKIFEDDNAYYLTGCGDNGEVLYVPVICRVDKKTREHSRLSHTDPEFWTPKRFLPFPPERKNIFIEIDPVAMPEI